MGQDGANKINALQKILKQQEEILSAIDLSLTKGKLDEVEETLSQFTLDRTALESKSLLSKMSNDILAASKKATDIGIPKIKKRQSTVMTLRQVGLDKEHT